MVLKVCRGSEKDPSLPSNAPHSWEGEEQEEEMQVFRASFPQRHSLSFVSLVNEALIFLANLECLIFSFS